MAISKNTEILTNDETDYHYCAVVSNAPNYVYSFLLAL